MTQRRIIDCLSPQDLEARIHLPSLESVSINVVRFTPKVRQIAALDIPESTASKIAVSFSELIALGLPPILPLFHVFGALAQFERTLISERVTAGLQAARNRGRIGGRPKAISSEKLTAILEAVDSGMSKPRNTETNV